MLLLGFALVIFGQSLAGLMAGAAPASPPEGYTWPVNGRILTGFRPATGGYGEGGHQGIDIAAEPGTPVRAAAGGTVVWVGEVPRGRVVSIEHGGAVRTTYLGLERIDVSAGSTVYGGQLIGTVAGTRDDSSGASHLHFGANVNGVPVDPLSMLGGGGDGSFIRLCPVEPATREDTVRKKAPEEGPSAWDRIWGGICWTGRMVSRPFVAVYRVGRGFVNTTYDLVCRGINWCARKAKWLWDHALYPFFRTIGRGIKGFFKWVWSNRWVRAVAAAVAAAVIMVLAVAAVFATFGLSLAVGIAAALGAIVASFAAAFTFTALNPDLGFFECFLRSLGAAGLAAGVIGSAGSLGSAFAAGWAELTLTGTVKAAFWGGVFSGGMEFCSGLLFRGGIDWRAVAVAFGAGALAGALGKLLAKAAAVAGPRLGLVPLFASRGQGAFREAGHALLSILRGGAAGLGGLLKALGRAAARIAPRAVFVVFNGGLCAGLQAGVCILTGRPLTFSGFLAALIGGSSIGLITLGFMGRGFEGLLERFRFFATRIGAAIKGYVAGALTKGTQRAIRFGFEKLFKHAFREEGST